MRGGKEGERPTGSLEPQPACADDADHCRVATDHERPPSESANPTICGRRHVRQRLVLECVRIGPGRLRLGPPCPPDHRTTVSAARFNQSIVALASVTQSRMIT